MSTEQRIFISYRRDDAQFAASALNDGLRNRLPEADVFMDLDSIPPGADFEEHIRNYIDECDVVLVVIGDEWLDPEPGTNMRRIDRPNDFVRLEILSALRAPDVKVIPVLVEGARMPSTLDLPDDIAGLARLNAFTVSDSHLGRDITELTNHLRGAAPETPAHAPAEPTVTFADLDLNAVRYAISSLPGQFATKDVSEHPAVLATHEGVSGRGNYHTMVGRFLMQHRSGLGLGSPEAPQGDRGSRWTKVGSTAPHAAPTPPPSWPQPQMAQAPHVQAPTHYAPDSFARSQQYYPNAGRERPPAAGKWLIILPILSFGLLAFVPPLWAASQVKHDPARRKRLFQIAGALGLGIVLAFILLGTSPTDAEGSATGPTSTVGAFLLLGCWITGIVIAVMYRNPARE